MDKEERKYQITSTSWNKVAKEYEDKFMKLDIYQVTYEMFICYFKNDVEILDVGCGPGVIASYIQNEKPSWKMYGVDLSTEMIHLAKKNIPSGEFFTMDIREISKLNQRFSGVICGFALPYLSAKDCLQFISDTIDLLIPNGILYLSFVEGDYSDSNYIKGSTGDEMFFYYHSYESISNQLISKGYEIVYDLRILYNTELQEFHRILISKKIK